MRCKHGVHIDKVMCLACYANDLLGGYQDDARARADLRQPIDRKDEDTIDNSRGER